MPNHDISLTDAAERTANFRNEYINLTKCFSIAKGQIGEILQQDDCHGLRMYLSIDDTSEPNRLDMVLVGVDFEGDDMTGGVLKNSTFGCPPNCSESNELNGL